MNRFLLVLYTTLVSACFGASFAHAAASLFDVKVQNNSTSPLYYVITTTSLTSKVLDPLTAIRSILPLAAKTTGEVSILKQLAKRAQASATSAPLLAEETKKRSKSTNRLTELTQLFAATDKALLENRINGEPLSPTEKQRVVVKRFPQDIRSHCTGTLIFVIKNTGEQTALPNKQAITVTRNDKQLTCTLFAPEQPAATPVPASAQEEAPTGAPGFATQAKRVREKVEQQSSLWF